MKMVDYESKEYKKAEQRVESKIRFYKHLSIYIIVNILLVHLFLDMQGLPVGIFLVFANSFLAYNHRESYKTLFVAK